MVEKLAPQNTIDEMRALVQEGDINLADVRSKIKHVLGRETKLTDEELLEALAAQQDDDDEELATHCLSIEDRNTQLT